VNSVTTDDPMCPDFCAFIDVARVGGGGRQRVVLLTVEGGRATVSRSMDDTPCPVALDPAFCRQLLALVRGDEA
jgi:hypothetical protein